MLNLFIISDGFAGKQVCVLAWGMAMHRTREQKLEAQRKRMQLSSNNIEYKKANNTSQYYYPEMSLDVKNVKADLTRTLWVTILAAILQLILFLYLNQAHGWQKVLSVISKITL